MARASLGVLTVRYDDGEYTCYMKRIPARKFSGLAKIRDEVDSISDDDLSKGEQVMDVMLRIVNLCIDKVVCVDEGGNAEHVATDELESGRVDGHRGRSDGFYSGADESRGYTGWHRFRLEVDTPQATNRSRSQLPPKRCSVC